MSFIDRWHALLDELDSIVDDGKLVTPRSHDRFRVTDVREHRIVIAFEDSGERRSLDREQFETFYERIRGSPDGFDLDRLPPDADPYPAVLSVHPRFEILEDRDLIVEHDDTIDTDAVDATSAVAEGERVQPEGIDIYADALLLLDAIERHDVSDLSELETTALVNLYTLCSDVQRNANEFRTDVAEILLERIHHDRPISGQYGSIQRTSRRNRSLKDDEEVIQRLQDVGIDRERVTSLDPNKVDRALEVTELPESAVYEVDETEYVRKAEVDESVKESRLQGLKDRLAANETERAESLRREIEALEASIDDLTSFNTGTTFRR